MDIFKVFKARKRNKIIEALYEEKEEIYFLGVEDVILDYLNLRVCTTQGRKVDGIYCNEGYVSNIHLKELADGIIKKMQERRPEYKEYFDEKNLELIAEITKEEILIKDMYDIIVYREINNGNLLVGVRDPEYIPF